MKGKSKKAIKKFADLASKIPQKIQIHLPKKSDLKREDLDFISDSKDAILTKTTPFARAVLFILAAFIIIGIIWAKFSIIDEMTRSMGKVVPSSQVQIIQNLEGGIVSQILVSEGERVKKGQTLLKLDDTRFSSQYRENHAKYLAILASIARLTAETEAKDNITFPKEVTKHKKLVEQEKKLFNSRQKSLHNAIKNLKHSFALVNHEIKITEPLVEKGVMSKIELLRLQRESTDIKGKLDTQTDRFKEQASDELTKKKAEQAVLSEAILAMEDRMVRTTVRSPVDGIVKQVYANTVGGVIQPGKPIMEIVPLNDKLQIEAKIKPSDIAFIHPGQKATVKITAYDYAIYGGLNGKVTHISADTSTDQQGNSFYEATIVTNKNHLGSETSPLPIIPGMTASVDILTGKKSILTYLLKPILRAKGLALRER